MTEIKPGDKVRLLDLFLRKEWNGCIATVESIINRNDKFIDDKMKIIRIKEFVDDDSDIPPTVPEHMIEKISLIPEELFIIKE